jgi:hypothetical protein
VPDLETIPVDLESAEDRVAVDPQNGFAKPVAIQRPDAPNGLDENFAAAVTGRSMTTT